MSEHDRCVWKLVAMRVAYNKFTAVPPPDAADQWSPQQLCDWMMAQTVAAKPEDKPAPVAVRYRTAYGRWRYLNYPFTKGWAFPMSLGTPEPLYAAPVVPQTPNGTGQIKGLLVFERAK
jgi:hypothetical protein